ncbi:malto-oligosyltrehalose synthase [Thermomicrobiaceae bacterium CFH 74404]|uniref:Malto-oligosyltrehalose synthase n=1 Tax=Thermalbibacter longus TaxID=2951981 RepID=A0AA41WAD9_9BACT|nr:malto-oligosyltrehalose synthase [Thermalbibacter longus]MCM8748601.1 malto-oligosyltrehalose synthase [Thermalbibacter longus]
MRVPTATYRLQLGPEMSFDRACAIVPYLAALGVSDLYLSPIFQARSGSTHGYDVTDPTQISAHLGGPEGFARLSSALREHGLGLLLDIVPNHQAAHEENPRWRAVLQAGRHSPAARFFDIDWNPPWPGLEEQLLLPVLGRRYAEALRVGELRLHWDDDGFALHYYDRRFPLNRQGWQAVLDAVIEELPQHIDAALHRAIERIARQVETEALTLDAAAHQLRALLGVFPELEQGISRAVERFDPGSGEEAAQRLDRLIAIQHYRPAFWRSAIGQLNYRRFFDISDLAGVRVEDPLVFDATHRLIVELVRSGQVTGLRVDHIDGLADPGAYLEMLQRRAWHAPDAQPAPGGLSGYVVVEKILTGDEALPEEWPVAGTTGYEFARQVTRLFLHPEGSARLYAANTALSVAWSAWAEVERRTGTTELSPGQPPGSVTVRAVTGHQTSEVPTFAEVADQARRQVLRELFGAELDLLASRLARLAQRYPEGRDLTAGELCRALFEVTATLPVYRTYRSERPLRPADRASIEHALAEARQRWPEGEPALAFLETVLLAREWAGEEWLGFVRRWQQLTGAAMAKGVEDTALYRDARLLALNEVGAEPDDGPLAPQDFHRWCGSRLERWPQSLNATSTHDTKRSEDARARLCVLADLPDAWQAAVGRWRDAAAPFRAMVDGEPAPEPAMELLCYQSLLAAWPLDPAEQDGFSPRLQEYLVKAAREAKLRTSWLDPNEPYERALARFVEALLTDRQAEPFCRDFHCFWRPVAFHGALTSLAQTAIKLTAPGVPDLYQGCELWCFSLVDPDNRRPVDFARREAALRQLHARGDHPVLASELLETWEDGRIKLHLTTRLLSLRRDDPELFGSGSYLPLASEGSRAESVVAFVRQRGKRWSLTAVPRFTARLVEWEDGLPARRYPLGQPIWQDTALVLPSGAPRRWQCRLTGERVEATGEEPPRLPLAQVFARWPVAVLLAEE